MSRRSRMTKPDPASLVRRSLSEGGSIQHRVSSFAHLNLDICICLGFPALCNTQLSVVKSRRAGVRISRYELQVIAGSPSPRLFESKETSNSRGRAGRSGRGRWSFPHR